MYVLDMVINTLTEWPPSNFTLEKLSTSYIHGIDKETEVQHF